MHLADNMASFNDAEIPQRRERANRQRLNVDSAESRERMERILREQLDLELFLKQKEINTISSNLRHGEALLKVLETAIKSLRLTNTSPGDISDGYLSFLRRSVDSLGQQQSARGSSGFLRERPRRAAATVTPKYTTDYPSSGALCAQNSAGETVVMMCPACQRDRFASLQGFLTHCRVQHGLDFASYDEAIRTCGHRSHCTANSELAEGSSITSGWALNVHSLANRLDSTQLDSVNDALAFINRPRVLEAESSDSENGSDSQSTATQTRHLAKSAIIPGSKPVSDVPQALESRFHVIRRAILGNSSQYVAPQNRPSGEENSTHKWTVYIRSASTEHPTDNYIRKVRVFLHPSYRPDDIVDLVPPDFALTRWGWGEFPVRLQVFFRDKRNKPVDLIHMLKLDDMWTGNAVLGAEKTIDFELDRRGLEVLPPLAEDHASTVACDLPPDNPILYEVLKHLCSIHPLVLADALPHGRELPESPEQILDMVPASVVEKWTWGVAVSEDIWRSAWPVGKRLAAEESRNRALLALISRALPKLKDVSLINTGLVDSLDASKDAKQTLSDTVDSIIQACGSGWDVVESFRRMIGSSDSSICNEASEALLMWRDGVPSSRRTIAPDRTRGHSSKPFSWSLRRFLRHYRLVPLPVLSSDEQEACLHLAAWKQGQTGHTIDRSTGLAHAYAAGQNGQTSPVHVYVVPERQPRQQDALCNFCGVLAVSTDFAKGLSNDGNPPFYCSRHCSDMGIKELTTLSSASKVLAKLPAGWDKSDDEYDVDIMMTVDGDKTISEIKNTASSIRAHHLEQQGERDLGDHFSEEMAEGVHSLDENDYCSGDRAIDWVWASIRPLELTCAPASRFTESGNIPGTNGNANPEDLVQLPNCNDEAFGEALEQRLVVGELFVDIAKLFLRDIISASDKAMRTNRTECIRASEANAEKEAAAVSRRKVLMLTPLHVLLAAKRNPGLFEVCTNTYFGAEG